MFCSNVGCMRAATHIVHWPGEVPRPMCEHHKIKALAVGKTMGFHVPVEVVGGPLQDVHAACGDALDSVRPLFKPGAKFTIVVRRDDIGDADIVVTDDELERVMQTVSKFVGGH